LLDDPKVAFRVASPNSTNCEECISYILPGTLQDIEFVSSQLSPQETHVEGSTSYVALSAPGYQLDFYPVVGMDFPESACNLYGDVELCLLNLDGDLFAGWSACLADTNGDCTTPPDQWATNIPTAIHLRMSTVLTNTAFNLDNGSIASVTPVSPVAPVLYPANGIFGVLDQALSNSSVQSLIYWMLNENSLVGVVGDIESSALRNLITCAFYEYNWGTDWTHISDALPTMRVEGYYAAESYRLVIADYSLVLFVLLASGVLTWCLSVLLFCWFVGKGLTPNRSDFAEWDFASKCVGSGYQDRGMSGLMRGLANATSREVNERIKSKWIIVGVVDDPNAPVAEGRVVIATEGVAVRPLKSNSMYT